MDEQIMPGQDQLTDTSARKRLGLDRVYDPV